MALFDHLPLSSQRVRLRRLRASDFRAFHAYRSDPDVARYQGWSPMSEDEAMTFLRENGRNAELEPGEWAQIGIASLDDDRLIGDFAGC
jgi:RimJ/RimL family protein N-acetyltransferase